MAIKVPKYYEPRPYQQAAWARRLSGDYDVYFKYWHRQCGKDADDISFIHYLAFTHPGTQSAYIGLDNKWLRRNIWNKYLNGRTFWDDYPDDILEHKDTAQQVLMHNNPEDKAPALVQYLGFKESQSAIGSSYDNFFISELSLYRRDAFNYIQPIWDSKKAIGSKFLINANFTPRGVNNIAADFLRMYTKVDEPENWPGKHGRVYVDFLPADRSYDSEGNRLFSDELLEDIRQRYIHGMGNDLMFRQEYMCDFLAVNAGLVFPGIENVRKENRYVPINFDTTKPVFMAWDISSKDKLTDWTSAVIFQYYNGRLFILDWYEDNRKAVVECVQELAQRPYFHLIRAACLPWDSDRSGSSSSPLEECRRAFPNITWHKLDRSYVSDGINKARALLSNAIINSNTCDWLMECFENWEYRELASTGDWSATPKHDRYSHLMDACLQEDTIIETLAGPCKISEADEVGYVMTDDGFKPYWNLGVRKISDTWLDIELDTGQVVSCTEDHVFPTIDGLKYARELSVTDTLRYNNLQYPTEKLSNEEQTISQSDRSDRMEWRNLVSLSRREVLSTQGSTPSPRCIQALLRGDTEGLPCSSCGRKCEEQLTREPDTANAIRTYEAAYERSSAQGTAEADRRSIMGGTGSQAERMGKLRDRQGLVPTALERKYWQVSDTYRARVRPLSQAVHESEPSLKVLLSKLQDESSQAKIKRITRRRSTQEAWCLEVEGQFFYANGILTKNCRYCAEFLDQVKYLTTASGKPNSMPSHYGAWYLDQDEESEWDDMPPGMRPSKFSPLRKKSPRDVYKNLDIWE